MEGVGSQIGYRSFQGSDGHALHGFVLSFARCHVIPHCAIGQTLY